MGLGAARTGIQFTPHRQLAAQQFGAFAHATHPVVSGARVFQMLRVNALPVVPHPQPELSFVIVDFHFHPLRIRVLEGIAHGLACNAVDLVSRDRMQVPRRAFHLHIKLGAIGVRLTAPEFFAQSAYCQRKIVGHHRR